MDSSRLHSRIDEILHDLTAMAVMGIEVFIPGLDSVAEEFIGKRLRVLLDGLEELWPSGVGRSGLDRLRTLIQVDRPDYCEIFLAVNREVRPAMDADWRREPPWLSPQPPSPLHHGRPDLGRAG
jgi:hypothetical protein